MEPKNKMLFPLSHWVGIARQPACVWCVGIHKIIKSDFLYIKNPSILFAQDWAGENPVSLPGTVPLAFILLFFSYFFQELRNIFLELRGFVWCVFSLFDAFDGWTNCPKISEVSWWAVCSCCRHEIGLFVAFSLRWSGARVLFLIRKKGETPVLSWAFLMQSRQLALLGAIGSRTGHHRCCPTNWSSWKSVLR